MKYIKKYEIKAEIKAEINDYVLINPNLFTWAKNLIGNSIGQITDIQQENDNIVYTVYYNTLKNIIAYNGEIIAVSKTKEELELILQSNKYNL